MYNFDRSETFLFLESNLYELIECSQKFVSIVPLQLYIRSKSDVNQNVVIYYLSTHIFMDQ